jgi:hypothetical protein
MINSYTSWQPLEECIVGQCYPGHYFDFIEDKTIKSQLEKILHETDEDLENLKKTIEEFGATVRRPDMHDKDQFQKISLMGGMPPVPPLTPRDWQISIGDKLVICTPHSEMHKIIDEYEEKKPGSVIDPFNRVWNPDVVLNGAVASCIARVGRDIFVDNSYFWTPEHTAWLEENVLKGDYRVHEAITQGHGDSVFAILKPGVILSTYHAEDLNLEKEFPGWDILKLMDPTIKNAMDLGKFKEENFNGQWYVHGQHPTSNFGKYVDEFLDTWVGESAETVFDVNCLVLDEHHVIFSGYNKSVWDFCAKHHIEPIICELRYQYFWDGGISCCTQDIRRKGGLETYL